MFKRVLLGFLFVASISWIAYYAWDVASSKNNHVPELVFSQEDDQLLIVLQPDEINFSAIESFEEAPSLALITALNDSAYVQGFFSQKRSHFLIIGDKNWNPKRLQRLFNGKKPRVEGKHVFIEGYEGEFYKTSLYLHKGMISHSGNKETVFPVDKKASASLLSFGKNGVNVTTDIYFKANGRVNYITRNANIAQGTQIKDESIFAGLVSRNISSYHFYERDYYATIDNDFAGSPMYKWLLNGFVITEYDGEKVLVSDYLGGQDPILILNDLNQTLDSNRFSNPLMSDFPSTGKSYAIKYLEDVVVISESEAACDKMIADYKLGNTIASSNTVRYRYFGELPKSVSERFVGKESSYSKAVYQGRLMETYTGIPVIETPKEMSASVNLSCGFDIKDFAVLPGHGNVVALGTKGEVACFQGKKLAWKKQLSEKILGSVELIDLHYNGEVYVLLSTESALHLWDLKGTNASGFPITLETEATSPAKFYRWKERSYFLVGNATNKLVQFDAQGRELNAYSINQTVSYPIEVWVSQKRLFVGVSSQSGQFTMYEIEKRKALRSFDILPNSRAVKVPNQLFHFSINNNGLVRTDQKGNNETIENYPSGKMLHAHNDKTIAVQTNNTLHLLNEQGIGFTQINLPFSDIADIYITTPESGKTYICVIDALENNVYLYSTDGTQLGKKALEGQTRVHFQTVNGSKCITTVVDQFVIQYIED